MSEQKKTVQCRLHYTWGDRLKHLLWGIAGSLLAALAAKVGPVSFLQEVLRDREVGCYACSVSRLEGRSRSQRGEAPMDWKAVRRPHRTLPPFGEGRAGQIPRSRDRGSP